MCDWSVKITSMQLAELSKIFVGLVIAWLMPYENVRQSGWAPSAVAVSLNDQLWDLELMSPIISYIRYISYNFF